MRLIKVTNDVRYISLIFYLYYVLQIDLDD